MADERTERRNKARIAILELANMISVPMSLQAIVRLNVPDAIWQGGANTPLSASQILSRVLPSGDPENLQRLLRMLTSYHVFAEHIINASERRYSLTEIGQTLVTDDDGLSYAPYVLQHHQDALVKAWPLVHEAVADPTVEPFVKANGESAYAYYGKNPEMNELMQRAMSGVSVPFMKAILDGYDGFQGVQRLVDVGGSAGDCMRLIRQKHPTIREGINFDLPEVVAKAPNIPARESERINKRLSFTRYVGVTHVGGDMFKSIPTGDAIFMKWVLTWWTDDECKSIMKNCYNSIPIGGKIIVCEPMLPEESDSSHRTRTQLEVDIFIMTMSKGKHRTEEELRQLGLSTGFPKVRAFYIDHFFTVLEFQK
ncbi:hypothetical protein HHK36_019254 [Tetracentron sinense]|uniref:Uncharacterized protein n=1 Tax=Tetracentron sinense TaxID=13715 RepID=A0A835D9W1_TETSI|nr:hypothetical protein HHK36_019254 [Tetracentron sinense]